jgi:hypothetical protein
MVIRASIRPRTNASKAPGVNKAVEGVIVTVFKEERHYKSFKEIGLENFP